MHITKQRIKQLLLLITTCFFIAISLTSCEKDLYQEGIKNSSRNLTVTHVSLSGLDKTTSSKINEKITLLKNLSKKTNSQGRFEYNSALDIYIDTENGKLVNNNGKLYYTFPMFRKTEENLENIIFAPLASGEMETYCAKYNVTPEVFKDLTVQQIENLNPTIQKIDANSFEYTCVTISWTVTTYPGCIYPDGMHSNGQQCDAAVVAFSMQFCNVSFGGGSTTNGGDSGPGVSGPSDGGPTGNGGANPVSGISTSPTNISEADKKKKGFIKQLTDDQSQCLNELPDNVEETLLNLLNVQLVEDCAGNTYTDEEQFDAVEEQLDSLCGSNSEEALDHFQNWFSNNSEGLEDNFNVTLLEDSNATFPPQNLPTFDDFLLAYPSHYDDNYTTSQQVYEAVGGAVLVKYNNGARNTCALRVSKGLNYSGVSIPNIPGVTVKGNDNKNYFLVASNLLSWMKSTFGTPIGENHLTCADGGLSGTNYKLLLAGKQGIYIMIPNDKTSAGFDASGHADIYYDNDCDGGCYFNATGGVKDIYFWNLTN